MKGNALWTILVLTFLAACSSQMEKSEMSGNESSIRIMSLAPGHFHAGLIHKDMYEEVDSTIYVFAQEGPELDDYITRIEGYNSRSQNPTEWKINLSRSNDPLEEMVQMAPGNVMVVAGKNDQKIDYILEAIKAGFHIYADKPLVINIEGYNKLLEAFTIAEQNDLILFDIMTERYEITSILQKELSRHETVFGTQVKGTPDNPGISKESVHHFYKTVSGKPLVRPDWFFDSKVEGDGLVDVTTHLVDLIQWSLASEQNLSSEDLEIISSNLWSTRLTSDQFLKVTGQELGKDYMDVECNGEMIYTLNGVNAKVSVTWEFQAPEGAGDTHFSQMRGTKANLIIKQGEQESFIPNLYVELLEDNSSELESLITDLQINFPGVDLEEVESGMFRVNIPDSYRIGHEAHFEQVTERFLDYFKKGALPEWEVDFMKTKYFLTTKASELAKKK